MVTKGNQNENSLRFLVVRECIPLPGPPVEKDARKMN